MCCFAGVWSTAGGGTSEHLFLAAATCEKARVYDLGDIIHDETDDYWVGDKCEARSCDMRLLPLVMFVKTRQQKQAQPTTIISTTVVLVVVVVVAVEPCDRGRDIPREYAYKSHTHTLLAHR